jgi:pimeloyl-ACP methyl ester carboxylesterase
MPIHEAVKTSVVSRDGTEIVYWTSGDGPPLVLVHGAPADHARWRPLLPFLEQHVTVHAIDRRGRGGTLGSTAWNWSTKTLRPSLMPWRRRAGNA